MTPRIAIVGDMLESQSRCVLDGIRALSRDGGALPEVPPEVRFDIGDYRPVAAG